MKAEAFRAIHDAESKWWGDGRLFVIGRILDRFLSRTSPGKPDQSVCDFGAGYGTAGSLLARYGKTVAFEPNDAARKICRIRGYGDVIASSDIGEVVNTHRGKFSLIALLDVLEHVEDDGAFLRTLSVLLTPNGKLLINVPAFMFLWSKHDENNLHFRRYTKRGLTKLLEKNGYAVTYASYWNMLLFFPAALVRLSGKTGTSAFHMHPLLDRLFYKLIVLESLIMPRLRLPFGTSIIVLAEKK